MKYIFTTQHEIYIYISHNVPSWFLNVPQIYFIPVFNKTTLADPY